MGTAYIPEQPKEIIRVSISEAARLFGINPLTIRRALKDGEITYVIVAGRYKLNFESLVKWSQLHTTIKNKLALRGIGQFVDKWKITNPLYSPNPKSILNPTIAGDDGKPTDKNQPEKNKQKTNHASA